MAWSAATLRNRSKLAGADDDGYNVSVRPTQVSFGKRPNEQE